MGVQPTLDEQIEFVEQELVGRALLFHKIPKHLERNEVKRKLDMIRAVWNTLRSLKNGGPA